MKKFNWALLISAILLSVSIVFYGLCDRFYLHVGERVLLKFDKLNGALYKTTGEKWEPIAE